MPPRVLVYTDVPAAAERLLGVAELAGLPAGVETRAEKTSDALRDHDPRAALLWWRGGNLSALLVGRLMNFWPLPVVAVEPPEDGKALMRALRADAWDVAWESQSDAELADVLKRAAAEGERLRAGGRARLGPYELGEVLGRGGNGTVYAGRHLEKGLDVALKVLHPDYITAPEYIARFTREAQGAMRLDHPNLMKVHEAGRARHRVYLAMERVDGRTLDTVLRDEGRLDPVRALTISRRLAEGLQHAHGMGLVHRDLKPGNIVLGNGDSVKILDFGLLKPAESESVRITQDDEFIGTLQYAAPEQLRGERVDGRCDLYSLGVVLYEMLAGARPHPGTDSQRVAIEVASGKPPVPLVKANPSLGPELAKLVHRMLSPVVVLRPHDAAEAIRLINERIASPWS